jgi:hypothetical protein
MEERSGSTLNIAKIAEDLLPRNREKGSTNRKLLKGETKGKETLGKLS